MSLQCPVRGCSHLSWAVLLDCFSQVSGHKRWSSCCLTACKATDGLRPSRPSHRKVCGQPQDDRLPQASHCPHSERSVILLDLSANFSLTVKSWCLIEAHDSKCGLQTSRAGITWELVGLQDLRSSTAPLHPQFTPILR